MGMYGADADALGAAARAFVESSHRLRIHRRAMTAALATTPWSGPDAQVSRDDWERVGAPALARISSFLETLGSALLEQAAAQRRASGEGLRGTIPSAFAPISPGGAVAGLADRVGRIGSELADVVDELLGRLADGPLDWLLPDDPGTGAAPPPGPVGAPVGAPVVGLRPSRFDASADGRAGLIAAMGALADGERVRRDEIEIRALDNGRYVVVLPGVTDLSEGLGQFVDRVRDEGLGGLAGGARSAYGAWADNDEPTVRKMRYAVEAALRDDTTVNEYSTTVAAAMQRAGVPAGAEVMLVGHSFGAYTAVDLAADPTFNAAAGGSPEGDDRVRVTHVVAAAAETDWRFDEIPAATRTLVLNNRLDVVYLAEDLLHRNAGPTEPGHVETVFWGGRDGFGHDEHNYLGWLASDAAADRDDLAAWLDEVGARYAAAGIRVSVRVPDPHIERDGVP